MQKECKHKSNVRPKRPTKIVVLVILVAILTPLSMYYVRYRNTRAKIKQYQAQNSSKTRGTSNQPKFHFYTLLPQTEVEVKSAQPVPLPVKPKASSYVLQVGALKSHVKAEKLQQKLNQLSTPAYVQAIRSQGDLWYRVYAGPYPNLNQAKRAQQKLVSHRLNSLLLRFQYH